MWRVSAIVLGVAMLAGNAHADARIVNMTPLFAKESAGCEVSASGVAKIQIGASALAAEHPDDAQLQADAARLTAGLEQLRAYCSEVASMVAFLKQHAKSPYKSVEKDIDARDNKIRKQRREAKQLTAELSPITRRLIPRIAAAKKSVAPPAEKLVEAKFPSGRTILLPALGGTWKVSGNANVDNADYADKTLTASVTARAKLPTTCDKHRIVLEKTEGVEQLVDAEIPSSAKDMGIVWRITYTRRDTTTVRHHEEICAEKAGAAYRVTAFAVPASVALPSSIVALMIRMLSAQTGQSPSKS